MSILAVAATFAGDPDPRLSLTARDMLAALPGWTPDGCAVAAGQGAALGIGKLVVSRRQGHATQPLVDAESGLHLVADLRLDNRDELAPRFGLAATATDAEILLAGYRRLGAEVVPHLIGDYAFVVWNDRTRRLFAARDPYGTRPLVYRQLPDLLLVASDVEQILAVDPSARVVDDVAVVDWLLVRWRFDERSFFAPITHLTAGSQLEAGAGGVRVTRWWRPTPPGPAIRDERAGLAEFRAVFTRAVADRLVTDHPVLTHLSGGYDSSVVSVVAGQVAGAPGLRAVGAVHPGLSCDEAPLMQATAALLPFPFEPWDGTVADLSDLTAPVLAGPGLRAPRSNGTNGDLAIARREGARVILSGVGGDGLHPHFPLVGDFIAQRRWSLFLRATVLAEGASWARRRRLSREALKQILPAPIRQGWQRFRHHPQAPAWLAPRFAGEALAPLPDREDFRATLGHGGTARWHEWRRPVSLELMRSEQRLAAEAGIEYRSPFLDLRVAAVVDRLPLSLWRPPRYHQRLHAIAYADLLPPGLRGPRRKTVFSPAVVHRFQASQGAIERLLTAPSPKFRHYVAGEPISTVRTLMASLATAGGGADASVIKAIWQDAALVWRQAALAAWLEIV
jgi:asparagine synthase (glutamine-hydrolysing)